MSSAGVLVSGIDSMAIYIKRTTNSTVIDRYPIGLMQSKSLGLDQSRWHCSSVGDEREKRMVCDGHFY